MRRQFLLAFLASLTLAASPIAADEVFFDEIPSSQDSDFVFEEPMSSDPENYETTEEYESTENADTWVSFDDNYSDQNPTNDNFEVQEVFEDTQISSDDSSYYEDSELIDSSSEVYDLADVFPEDIISDTEVSEYTTDEETAFDQIDYADTLPQSGTCGDNCTWTLEESGGQYVLTISGTGSIGDYTDNWPWKNYRFRINKIIVNSGISRIGTNSFLSCTKLVDIQLPSTLKEIGESALQSCTKLEHITIPDSVSKIETKAFYRCTSLTEIALKDIDTIGENAFEQCKALKTVRLSGNINSIGTKAFYQCTALENVYCNANIGTIYKNAFSLCSAIKELTINGDIGTLTRYSFGQCYALEKITFEGSIDLVEDSVFGSCDSLKEIYYNGDVKEFKDTERGSENITVEKIVFNGKVGKIGWGMVGSSYLKELYFNGKVDEIADGVFASCTQLKTLEFNGDVDKLGEQCFTSCIALKDLKINGNIKDIGFWAFYQCYAINELDFHTRIDKIGTEAFSECKALNKITFNGDIETIGEGAFSKCTGLEKVVFDGTIGTIGEKAFSDCTTLKQIDFEKPIGAIGEKAFYNCSALKELNFKKDLEKIGAEAFSECTALEQINITSTIGTIGEKAFTKCTQLKQITFNGTIDTLGAGSFSECTSLEQVTFDGTIKTIGEKAFLNCTGLKTITYTEAYSDIDFDIYTGCDNVEMVTIPNATAKIYGTPPDNDFITFIGHYDSTTQDYAEKWGNKFISMETPPEPVDPEGVDVSFNYSETREAISGSNEGEHNYQAWNHTKKSYLITTDQGYMRVQHIENDDILVEYYSSSYKFLYSKHVRLDFPIFGTFYSNDKYYYVVTGQMNRSESPDVECCRVTKYNHNWERLSSVGLKECNTINPYAYGDCIIVERGNFLIVHTCHEMYKTDDGANHQANLSFVVNTRRNKIIDGRYDSIDGTGAVSHSLNQFAKIDSDGRLVTVDHGDGHPRAFVLHKFRRDVANGSYGRKPVATTLFKFFPMEKENNTNASVGGFEISDSSYLVVGNSTYQTDFEKKTRNLLLSVTDKSTKTPRTIWLTDYKESEPGVETPHLVKLNNDRFMILWSEVGSSVVNYQVINGSGSTVGSTHQLNGYLSDCQPIVANNQVQWYTYNGYDLTFYGIDIDTLKSTTKRLGAEQKLTLNKQSLNFQLGDDGETLKPTVNPSLESGQNILWKSSDQFVATVDGYGFVRPLGVGKTTITAYIDNNPSCKAKCQVKVTGTLNNATIRLSKETYTYTGKALKPDVTVIVNGLTLTEGKDYTLQYDKNKNAGTAKVIVTGKGYYSGKKSKNFTIKKATQKFSVTAKAQTVKNVKKSKLTGVFTVKNNHGKVTYSKVSGSGNFTVDKSGVITVKKGTKKGTYKIKVKCKAAGDSNYKAAEKTVTVKITVK